MFNKVETISLTVAGSSRMQSLGLNSLLLIDYWGGHPPRTPNHPNFSDQNQGTRSSLMKTTSARQKALAKLNRADRNVLDASQC